MTEILLTSSVLILALLLLRRVFRQRISRRAQYALWGLVLLRLLAPVNLPAAEFSVLTAVQPARAQAEERLEQEPVYVLPVERREMFLSSESPPEPAVILPIEGRYTDISAEKGKPPVVTSYALTLEEALGLIWKAGMAVMALWLLGSNLRFWLRLRKNRIPLEFPDCRYPVYLMEEGLISPCLFGLFRPAVYLTPAAMEPADSLRHVLAHEETHGRQLDPLWSLLRGVCLAVYWFDPLVWWAAKASKEDCELSCDEGALKRLGESQRIPYGQTLLRLIPVKRRMGGILLTATTMTSDKKRLKERITRIAENRRTRKAALASVLVMTAAVCAVTFTGCASSEEVSAPLAEPAEQAEMEPVLTVPLTDLPPRDPVKAETRFVEALYDSQYDGHHGEHSNGHHGEYQSRHRVGGGCRTTEDCATFAWSYGGNVYVSSHDIRLSSFPTDYFLSFPEQDFGDEPFTYREEPFDSIFGYSGVMIAYTGQVPEGYYDTINDYYIFDEDGVYLLARVYGTPELTDLDGDGEMELVGISGRRGWECRILFRRDGQLYEADLRALLRNSWPELDEMEASYTLSEHGISLIGPVYQDERSDGTLGGRTVVRSREIFFDGESLQLYAPEDNYNGYHR